MKRITLITLALLAVTATAALAQGSMDLSWQACRTSANTGLAALNDVTAVQFNCSLNNSIRNLVCSVKTGTYSIFQGATAQVDFITGGGATLPDWWDVGGRITDPRNCRPGGLIRATVGTHSGCTNPYGPTASQQGGEAFFVGALGPGTYRMVADHVPVGGSAFATPLSDGGYAAMVLTLNSLGTVVDPDLDPTVLCNGCSVPACLVLNFVDFAADGAKRHIEQATASYGRTWVAWMGGTGANCPGATPTRNATWGKVKALYR